MTDSAMGCGKQGQGQASLRLPKSFPSLSVYRLIISKHYGYPLQDFAQNADIACSNWIHLFNSIELVKRETPVGRRLTHLVAMLRKTATLVEQEFLPEPRTKWIIRNLKFNVTQE